MIREESNRVEGSALSGGVIFLRALSFVFLPIVATALVGTIMGLVGSWGANNEIIYMRTEPILFGAVPFMIAVMISLIMKWTMSTKIALKIFYIAIIGFFVFVGIAAILETINTKPIVAAANSFKELPGLNREIGTNGDKFSPAPSGFVPCIDVMGFGCPNVTRTWNAPSERELSIDDLQKVLDDSGWKNVKILKDKCDMTDHKNGIHPDCSAEGMVGNYKATVRILESHDHWELRMYLRLPTNVR